MPVKHAGAQKRQTLFTPDATPKTDVVRAASARSEAIASLLISCPSFLMRRDWLVGSRRFFAGWSWEPGRRRS